MARTSGEVILGQSIFVEPFSATPDATVWILGVRILVTANLERSVLTKADFTGANLIDANLNSAVLSRVTLVKAKLVRAFLGKANLRWANATGPDFTGSNLRYASLVGADLQDAIISGSSIYGISVWDLKGIPREQNELVITLREESVVTVDNLEVAQFIYLLLNNQKIRDVIDTITSKVVLMLGRFTPKRKAILDGLRVELRKRDYLPVLFDFEKPANLDITETVSTLAHMARFVIADITDAKSIPQELMAIVPNLPSVPVQPLLLSSKKEYGMFEHFKRYPWVLEPFLYEDQERLLAAITEKVIGPAEAKAKGQTGR
jgi:uncharacterized protein YjbI with pentapeptide repeats